jgi:ATP-binding cassette subfamily B protein
LRSIGLFAQLDDETLELLAGRFSTDRLPEQRVVFEQGDPGDKFFILAHGSVDVVRRENGGPELLLATLREGDLFGEMALLADEPRSATIRTRTPCVFLTLSSHHFDQFMEAVPRLRASIEAIADERRRQTSDLLRQPA